MKSNLLQKISLGLDFKLLSLLFPYLKQYRRFIIVCFICLLSADALLISLPLFIQHGIDKNIILKDLDGLKQTGSLFLLALFMSFLLRVSTNYMLALLGQKLLFSLRMKLYEKVMSLSSDYFNRVPTGTTLTHVTNDVENVRQFISEGVVSVMSSLTKVFLILATMFYLNAYLACITILCIPVFSISTYWFKTSIRDGFRGIRKANNDINTQLVESINGHREIALFQNRSTSEATFNTSNLKYLNSYHTVIHAYALYLPLIENITHISTACILVISHYSIGNWIQIGEIFAFFTLINMFFRPLREIAEQFNTFQSAMAAMERIKILLDEKISIKSPTHPIPLPEQVTGAIEFKDVHFHYHPDKPVLQGLNFNIQPGEKVALVGSTGAGKSTIIHLMNRLYDIQKGDILFEHQSIDQYSLPQLRSQISTIPQEAFLFTGSILDNIRMYNPTITKEDVEKAIYTLKLEAFIEQLPGKYDYMVQEGGSALSSGQKQLIAFARAFVHRPKILILDEATANIDSKTESQIENALKELFQNKTSIIIAHRLSTIRSVDRILVLKHGRVVASGPHEELIQQDGLYKQLYEMQALALA